jgi:glycerol kinase
MPPEGGVPPAGNGYNGHDPGRSQGLGKTCQVKPYILSIDQGTTGSRALIVDHDGGVRGRGYAEIRQYYPRPGWVEHDALEIWQKTLQAIAEAKQAAGAVDKDIAAIGITNQRETTMLIDRRSGKPVGRAIVWQCRRTAGRCDELRAQGLADSVRAKTGLVIDAYFSATKLEWLLDSSPELRRLAERGQVLFATVDAWLTWKLTEGKVHATDFSNASRTMLFNINSLEWDNDLLELFRVPRAALPEVRPSSGLFGYTASGIPVSGVAGDQQAALFGQGCYEPGMAKATYGTGAFVLMNTGEKAIASEHGLLTTLACTTSGKAEYALEGSIFVAGAAVQWLRDELKLIGEAAESEHLAMRVEDTGGVYFVPAFVGLGAPYWDMRARGMLIGLTRGSGRAQITRAALESMAYQVADVVEAMLDDAGLPLVELRADGGAARNDFLMQFQADITDARVSRPEMLESTALGAAYLAGLATGFWQSHQELETLRESNRTTFVPRLDAAQRRLLRLGWTRAVERARGWLVEEEQSPRAGQEEE